MGCGEWKKRMTGQWVRMVAIWCVLVILLCGKHGVEAAEALAYGRIAVQMPQITAEINGKGYDKAAVSAFLGTESLKIEDLSAYDKVTNSVRAYVLVDLSTSMRRHSEQVKANIIKFVNEMGVNDSIVILTFGENEVKTLLQGGESKEEVINAVNGLQCNEKGTMFYEALHQAYQLANSTVSTFDREYVLVFSDGIDVQKGNSTYQEIFDQYKTHALPIYAACASNTSQEAADKLGELARASGGRMKILTTEQDFDLLLGEINDVSLLKLKASSNYADGQEKQLSVKIGELQVEQNIPIARSMADNEAPTIEELFYDSGTKSFLLRFSEPVQGALEAKAYTVSDEAKNPVEVVSVAEGKQENTVIVKLKELHNGAYEFSFHGITDNSREANALKETKTVKVMGIEEPKQEDAKEGLPIWVFVLVGLIGVVIVILIVVLVLVAVKGSSNKEQNSEPVVGESQRVNPEMGAGTPYVTNVMEYNGTPETIVKHHVKAANTRRIRMRIKTGRNMEQKIELDVVSSVIVGRSEMCDVCIDDTKMSRQHFAIENEDGMLYVMDLKSSNGTMLNGRTINSRQRLSGNDKITVGLTDVIIQF